MLIEDSIRLSLLCDYVSRSDVVAIDTEFAAERRYYPRFDLLQVGTREMAAAVDVRSKLDLSPLIDLLTSPERTVLMHAGEQDLRIFRRHFKKVPARIFDTQVAAGLVSFQDYIPLSGLVKDLLDVELSKGETLSDWSRRPLTPQQIEYALDDVRHLFALYDILSDRLEALGRTSWLEEESARMLSPSGTLGLDPMDQWQRLRASRRLNARQLLILQEVTAWRERQAMAKDASPRYILPDEVLIQIARKPPNKPSDLHAIRQIFARTVQQLGKDIIKAVRRGLERPEEEGEALLREAPFAGPPESVVMLLELAVMARAQDVGVSFRLMTNRQELGRAAARLRAGHEVDGRIASGWRSTVLGTLLQDVLRGEKAIRLAGDGETLEMVGSPLGDGG